MLKYNLFLKESGTGAGAATGFSIVFASRAFSGGIKCRAPYIMETAGDSDGV
jgi:hypothetical protein